MQAKATQTTYLNGKIKQTIMQCAVSVDTGKQERDVINLYPDLTGQTVRGFGGAITEAASYTLLQMPTGIQHQILQDVFGAEGLRYTMVRTSIDSCDFSLTQYEAASQANAPLDLSHDEASIIPMIHQAQKFCPEPIQVMLTPWSPPAYMKDNGTRSFGGRLKQDCAAQWADYICRYLLAYRRHGLSVNRISVQNEPNATQLWDSCLFTGEEEKRFLRDHLYPALQKNGLDDIEIYIWDHNKERLLDRAREVVDSTTEHMITGAAFHWYSGDHFEALRLVRRVYPDLELLFSEGCIEFSRFSMEGQLTNARLYAHDMIGNFNAGMNTFLDWNVALDHQGGPNHAQNFCDAPILCNVGTGTFEKRLSYYYIWHFSHFVSPGAVHISTTTFSPEVEAAAFRNPDGKLIVVLTNQTPSPRRVFLRLAGSIIELPLEADSIATVEITLD